jgi:hypothetical protein
MTEIEFNGDEIINDYVYLRVKRCDLFALNKSVVVEPSEENVVVGINWDWDDEGIYLSRPYVRFVGNRLPEPIRFEFVGESKKSKLSNVRLGTVQQDPWDLFQEESHD